MESNWVSVLRNKWVIASAIAIALLAVGLTLTNNAPWSPASTLSGAQQEKSIAQRVTDTLNALIGRSPGEREVGRLNKMTKGGKSAGPRGRANGPTQRALGKVFDTPEGQARVLPGDDGLDPGVIATPDEVLAQGPAGTGAGTPGIGIPGAGVGGPDFSGAPSPVLPGIGGGGGIIAPPGSIGGGGGPGGGGGGGTPPVIVNPPAPGPVPAVPEPSTWAMLLLGMAACGAMLRRRPRKAGAANELSCETPRTA